jgi:hypothetical protein
MRALPPPPGEVDLGEGFPSVAREAIEAGEQALCALREAVPRWLSVGGALLALQNVTLARSGANNTASPRYRRAYGVLSYAWPQLAKLDKSTRSNAIWLFSNQDNVLAWIVTLPQKQKDKWTHPSVIRRHYEKRHPRLEPEKPPAYRRHNPRQHRDWNRAPLGERSREDLIGMLDEAMQRIAERDQEILEKDAVIEEKAREIDRLTNDLQWEVITRKQLERGIPPMTH